jgi:hypothetical protein
MLVSEFCSLCGISVRCFKNWLRSGVVADTFERVDMGGGLWRREFSDVDVANFRQFVRLNKWRRGRMIYDVGGSCGSVIREDIADDGVNVVGVKRG